MTRRRNLIIYRTGQHSTNSVYGRYCITGGTVVLTCCNGDCWSRSTQKTSQFKTQCKGHISHAFKTSKIIVWTHDAQNSRCALTRRAAVLNICSIMLITGENTSGDNSPIRGHAPAERTKTKFAVYIDDICKLSNVINGTTVVLYADDILLIAPSVSVLQKLLLAGEKELDAIDMIINVKKVQLFTCGTPAQSNLRRNNNIFGLQTLLPAALRTATLSPLTFARHLKSHLFDWLTAPLRTI